MHTSDLGDHIGMESCVDIEITEIEPSSYKVAMNRKPCETSNRRRTSTTCTRKELPPPLPTRNSTVMKRYYTDDKRLVIIEEEVENPKFHFMARRSHGRLILQLVNNNYNNINKNVNVNINELSHDINKNVNVNINELSPDDDDHENVVDNDEVVDSDSNDGGDANDCGYYMYNATVRVAAVAATGPCLFLKQDQIHAIRPLQI